MVERARLEPVIVHEDARYYGHSDEDTEEAMDDSRDPLEESEFTQDGDDDGNGNGDQDDDGTEEEMEDSVADDIKRFEQSFKNITQRYRLINRIGEGRYSISN